MPIISNETLFSLQYFGVRASTGLLILGLLLLQINQSQKELFCINYWFCLQLSFSEVLQIWQFKNGFYVRWVSNSTGGTFGQLQPG